MDNFDLRKYLANNPLLENKLSPDEVKIVDDILSVVEGVDDVLNKLKSYAKKGLLTTVILTSVISQLKAQGQTDTAQQVEKIADELVITPTTDYNYVQPVFKKGFSTNFGKITLGINYEQGVYKIYELKETFTTYTPSYKYGYNQSGVMGELEFSSKEDLIKALQTGIDMIDKETPLPGQEYKVNIDGKTLLRKSSSGRAFWMNSRLVFTRNITQKALDALENFTPTTVPFK